VRSGGKRADFLFYDAATFAARYPDAVRAGSAPEGAVAIVLETSDLAAAAGASGVAHDGKVSVSANAANGVVLSFVS
jgi:hypothetical protein